MLYFLVDGLAIMSSVKWLQGILIFTIIGHASISSAQLFSGLKQTQIACGAYSGMLKSQGYTNSWKLDEKSGTTAADSIGNNTATYVNSPTLNITGPLVTPSRGITLNGTNQEVQTSVLQTNPTAMTLNVWFKTSTGGGKLIGYGGSQSGASSAYDRHIYMSAAGNINFGVYNGGGNVITTSGTYKDNLWHMATATFGPAGMVLYVDGLNVGSLGTNTVSGFNGYWRIGYDQLSGWSGSDNIERYTGSLSEIAVANNKVMSGTDIHNLYDLGKSCRSSTIVITNIVITSATYGAGVSTCDATAYASGICNGQPSCSVTASNGICGDPAYGTGKSIIINYTCSGVAKSSSAPENAGAALSCP